MDVDCVCARRIGGYLGDVGMKILSGAEAFLWQRISAYILFFYFPFAVVYLSRSNFVEYEAIQANLLNPVFLIPSLLVFVLLMVHVWIGLRDVLIDYLPRNYLVPGLVVFALAWLAIVVDIVFLLIVLMP